VVGLVYRRPQTTAFLEEVEVDLMEEAELRLELEVDCLDSDGVDNGE